MRSFASLAPTSQLPCVTLGLSLSLLMACGDDASSESGSGGASTTGGSTIAAGDPVSGPTTSSGIGGSTGTATSGEGGAGGEVGAGGEGGAGGEEGPWSCLGAVVWPEPETDTLRVQMVLENVLISSNKLGGLPVRFCRRDDLSCDDPVEAVTADDNGYVDAQVPITAGVGFDGYFEVGPGLANGETEVPVNVVMTVRPWTNDYGSTGNTPQGIVTTDVLGALLGAFEIEALDGRGHVAVIAKDCADQDAAGVVPSITDGGPDARVVYLANGNSPAPDATSTDDSGVAAIANVLAGRATLHAELEETGETVGDIDVIIRDGGVTSVGFNPTP